MGAYTLTVRLSKQDLNSIRLIVRDEIDRALLPKRDAADPSVIPDELAEENNSSGAPSPEELGRAMIRALRGGPKEKAHHLRLEARFRVATNERWWITRAMKARPSPSDAPVTVDEMEKYMLAHEERIEARRAQRQRRKKTR